MTVPLPNSSIFRLEANGDTNLRVDIENCKDWIYFQGGLRKNGWLKDRLYVFTEQDKFLFNDSNRIAENVGAGIRCYGDLLGKFLSVFNLVTQVRFGGEKIYINNKSFYEYLSRRIDARLTYTDGTLDVDKMDYLYRWDSVGNRLDALKRKIKLEEIDANVQEKDFRTCIQEFEDQENAGNQFNTPIPMTREGNHPYPNFPKFYSAQWGTVVDKSCAYRREILFRNTEYSCGNVIPYFSLESPVRRRIDQLYASACHARTRSAYIAALRTFEKMAQDLRAFKESLESYPDVPGVDVPYIMRTEVGMVIYEISIAQAGLSKEFSKIYSRASLVAAQYAYQKFSHLSNREMGNVKMAFLVSALKLAGIEVEATESMSDLIEFNEMAREAKLLEPIDLTVL